MNGNKFRHIFGPEINTKEWNRSLVLIGGLDGNSDSTWQSTLSDKHWYQRISTEVPGLSVLSIYPKLRKAIDANGQNDLLEQMSAEIIDSLRTSNILNRPTVFVGYSAGGILLKRIIIDLPNYDTDQYFRRRVLNLEGIVFLGTPHMGVKIAKTRLRRFYGAPSQTLIDLEPNSRQICDIQTRFYHAVKSVHIKYILNIYETLPSSVEEFIKFPRFMSRLLTFANKHSPIPIIVPPDSARIEMDVVQSLATLSCHRTLPRLEFKDSEIAYDLIRNNIIDHSSYIGSDPDDLKLLD